MHAAMNPMRRSRVAELSAHLSRKAADHLLSEAIKYTLGLILTGVLTLYWAFHAASAAQAPQSPPAAPLASLSDDKPPIEVAPVIRQEGDSWIFAFKGRIFVQNPKESFDYKFLTKLPATVQPVDGMNYRIEFATDTQEEVLVEACKNLANAKFIVAIEMANCGNVTNKVLEALSKNDHILDISLCDCNGFDDKGLAYLAKLPHLRQLGLYGANGIKGDGIRTVMKGCKSLDAVGIDRVRLEPAFVQQLHTEFHGQVKIHHRLITCECSK